MTSKQRSNQKMWRQRRIRLILSVIFLALFTVYGGYAIISAQCLLNRLRAGEIQTTTAAVESAEDYSHMAGHGSTYTTRLLLSDGTKLEILHRTVRECGIDSLEDWIGKSVTVTWIEQPRLHWWNNMLSTEEDGVPLIDAAVLLESAEYSLKTYRIAGVVVLAFVVPLACFEGRNLCRHLRAKPKQRK